MIFILFKICRKNIQVISIIRIRINCSFLLGVNTKCKLLGKLHFAITFCIPGHKVNDILKSNFDTPILKHDFITWTRNSQINKNL